MQSPVLVKLAALVFAGLGVIGLYFGIGGDRWLLYGGVVLLALAPMVWLGVRYARVPAAIVAFLASWPLLYGIWGLSVVTADYNNCIKNDRATASISFSSLPADYCETFNWANTFGVGYALIGIGAAALFAFVAILRDGDHFHRGLEWRPRRPAGAGERA